jgi:hypothetical protein
LLKNVTQTSFSELRLINLRQDTKNMII